MIARYNNISLALGIPGIILQVVGQFMRGNPENGTVGALVLVVGTVLLIGGLAMYAKAKGRSLAWGLMGFLSLIGLIVLALLKDHAPDGRQ
jgi:hypothetical protein